MRKQMKQIIAILLMMAVLLGGCGNGGVSQEEYDRVAAERDELKNENQESDDSTASANESEEMPDLSGNWEQEGKGDSYQAGYISDDVIEIYWITDDSKALYWSGSYEPPTEKTDSFSWESRNDKKKTDKALLASLDDSKIFTYDSGKISYEVTVQGVTQTVKLIPTDTDYSDSQAKASGDNKEQAEDKTQLTIPESATNGMWVGSYVDIQQKDGKYETKIYLDSVDATDAERLYFTAGVIMKLMDREVESDFYVITPSGEYKMNSDANGFEDMGLPKEWLHFFENGENGIQSVRNNISVAFSDSFENWREYSFDKYLDDVIIVEKESETEEQKETQTIGEKETEEEWETLTRKTYSYDDGSETTFLFSKDKENKFHLTISLNIDEKWKAAYAFTVLCNTIQIDELKEMNALVMLNCGDDTLTSSGLSVDSSGNLIKNSEWLTEGMKSEEFDSQTAEALLDDIKDSFSDFITNEMGKYLS